MLCNLRLTSHCSLVYLYSLFKSWISSLFFRKTQTFSCKSNANPCGELLISFLNNSSLFLPKTSKLLPTIKACWWVWKDTKINSSRILFGAGELYLTEIYGVQIILVSLFLVKNISVSEESAFMCVFSSRVLIFLSFTLWAISTLNWSTSVLKDTRTFYICYFLRDKGQMEW